MTREVEIENWDSPEPGTEDYNLRKAIRSVTKLNLKSGDILHVRSQNPERYKEFWNRVDAELKRRKIDVLFIVTTKGMDITRLQLHDIKRLKKDLDAFLKKYPND